MGNTVGALAFWLAAGGVGIAFLVGPVGQAVARRIQGVKADPATGLTTGEMTAERVAAMEERLLALEAERHQMEERLEFAERLLTRPEAGSAEPEGAP